MALNHIQSAARAVADPVRAEKQQRFFKKKNGAPGSGDRFLGLSVPQLRALAKEYESATSKQLSALLASAFHEERLLALLLLVRQYGKADESERQDIFDYYLANTDYVNNWDLVDTSCYNIVGIHLLKKSRKPLYTLARSDSIWERRIAIISTYQFIRHKEYEDTLTISKLLLNDKEDLIHKAVGWMLREVGNKDRETEERFLQQHYADMPRTMLRYAIEKFPEYRRQQYLKGRI